jgi:lysine N6-hydroxylase
MHGHREITNLFLDKKESFGWHDGLQMPDVSIQVSMLKDLVSLSEPTKVLSVEYAGVFRVATAAMTVTADNIVVGVGTQPMVPPQAQGFLGARQFHVSEFMGKAGGLGGLRVGVVGGEQSGAEAFLDLVSRPGGELPRRVAWISRRPNYFLLDDSPFTNDFYMPGYSDYFASLEAATRHAFNAQHLLTGDGISESTLRLICQRIYTHRFINSYPDLVALYPNRAVRDVTRAAAGAWNLALAHNDHGGAGENVELDVVIWATGFRPAPMGFLAPIESRLEREGDEYKIDDNFALLWDGPAEQNIFVQNAPRGQRGPPAIEAAHRKDRDADGF